MNSRNIFNTKNSFIILLITFGLTFSTINSHAANPEAQTRYKSSDVTLTISGTSTLHDWEMVSKDGESEVLFTLNDQGHPVNIESAVFKVDKKTLKSDKSGLDRRAYDALNANRHPEIIFRTNGGGKLENSGENYNISSRGQLTVGGVTKEILVDATCTNGEGKKLVCSGSHTLNMSDFNIDPPVMMLGALRTGDEITINYKIEYSN